MNKKNIGSVFRFSVEQSVKNKVFIILTVACGVLMLFLTPFMIYTTTGMAHQESSIKKVYIIDDNDILDVEQLDEKYTLVDEEFDKYKKEFEKQKDAKSSLLVHATTGKSTYKLDIYKVQESEVTDKDMSLFTTDISELYNDAKIKNMKLDTKSYELITADIETEISIDGIKNTDKESDIYVVSIVMMVIVFFIAVGGENIASQIVTEKSTKLVEYLLVTIRPLELVSGKILSSVAVSFIQMLVMVVCGMFSIVMSKEMGIISSYEDTLSVLKIKGIAENISVVDIFLILGFIIVGFIFYAVLAAMLASTVSRLEEIGSVNMIYSLITIISVYVVMFLVNFTEVSQVVEHILVVIPLTGVYVAPAYIMLGKLSMTSYVVAIIAQIALTVGLMVVASKVYMALIMHNGQKVSVGKAIKMAFNSKVGDASV